MCITVYYLNVSGLQSDRHSNKKETMFWTGCLCPLVSVTLFYFTYTNYFPGLSKALESGSCANPYTSSIRKL